MIFHPKNVPLGIFNFRICCKCYFHFFNPLPFIYQVDIFYNFLFFHMKFNLYLNGCRYIHFLIPQFIKPQIMSYYFQVYLKFIFLYQTHFFPNHNLMKLFIILLMKFWNRWYSLGEYLKVQKLWYKLSNIEFS